MTTPKCPDCGSNKQVTAIGVSEESFHCKKCGGSFFEDPHPAEAAWNKFDRPKPVARPRRR